MFYLISYLFLNCCYLILHISNPQTFPPPLNSKEEKKYFDLMKQGDIQAKNILIERNLRLVAHIIKKYYSNYKDQEDLISIGTIGLIKAINTFNTEKGTRFATYAARCIENEILMYFRANKRQNLEVRLNDPIDSDKDGNVLALVDILSFEENIDDTVDLKLKIQKLYDYIQRVLFPRECEIIKMRYGLLNSRPLTQREVAQHLCISRSYVSRIEKKALQKLKKEFSKDGITSS